MSLSRRLSPAMLLALFCGAPAGAQHFARTFETAPSVEVEDVLEMPDGSLRVALNSVITDFQFRQAKLIHTEANGDLRGALQLENGHRSVSIERSLPLPGGESLLFGRNEAGPWMARLDAQNHIVEETLTSDWVGLYDHAAFASDGSLWVCGWMSGNPNSDLLVGHLDAQLDWIDQRTLRGSSDVYETCLVPLPDGGVMVAGVGRDGAGSSDVMLTRLDAASNTVWNRRFGSTWEETPPHGPRLVAATHGGLYLCASRQEPAGGEADLWVVHLREDGTPIWEKTYDRGLDHALDLLPTESGGVVVAGTSELDGDQDFAILSLSPDGDVLWSKLLGGPRDEVAHRLGAAGDGDLVVVGTTTSFSTTPTEPELWMVRMGLDGSFPPSPWIRDGAFTEADASSSWADVPVTPHPELRRVRVATTRLELHPGQSVQATDNTGAFRDQGHGLAGLDGIPALAGTGQLAGADFGALVLSGARSNSVHLLVVGTARLDAPLFGGTLVPDPDLIFPPRPTGPLGHESLGFHWPPGIPTGFETYVQSLVVDPAAPGGFAFTNAVKLITP